MTWKQCSERVKSLAHPENSRKRRRLQQTVKDLRYNGPEFCLLLLLLGECMHCIPESTESNSPLGLREPAQGRSSGGARMVQEAKF